MENDNNQFTSQPGITVEVKAEIERILLGDMLNKAIADGIDKEGREERQNPFPEVPPVTEEMREAFSKFQEENLEREINCPPVVKCELEEDIKKLQAVDPKLFVDLLYKEIIKDIDQERHDQYVRDNPPFCD